MEKRKIVFYDGECGFCNRIVKFVLKNDKNQLIYFTSIQSSFTKELFELNEWEKPNLSTFYYLDDGVLYSKSKAALRLSKELKFPIRIFTVFHIVPNRWRDKGYDFIAKRRQLLSKDFCYLPNECEKKQFID